MPYSFATFQRSLDYWVKGESCVYVFICFVCSIVTSLPDDVSSLNLVLNAAALDVWLVGHKASRAEFAGGHYSEHNSQQCLQSQQLKLQHNPGEFSSRQGEHGPYQWGCHGVSERWESPRAHPQRVSVGRLSFPSYTWAAIPGVCLHWSGCCCHSIPVYTCQNTTTKLAFSTSKGFYN